MKQTWVDKLFTSGIYRQVWTENPDYLIGSEQSLLEVDQILALLKPKPRSHILDWCGGYGRHAIELARRGYDVTLLDYVPSHLREARECAEKQGVKIKNYIKSDFRQTPRDIQADYAINIFTSGIGYYSEADDIKALKSLRAALKKEAKIVIETIYLSWLIRHFQKTDWRRSVDGSFYLLEDRSFDFKTDTVKVQNTVLGPKYKKHEFVSSNLIYSAEHLCRVLTAAGFEPLYIFGGLDQSPLSFDSKRLVVVARSTKR